MKTNKNIEAFKKVKDLFRIEGDIYESGSVEKWAEFEKEHNIKMPDDYKLFVDHFGCGSVYSQHSTDQNRLEYTFTLHHTFRKYIKGEISYGFKVMHEEMRESSSDYFEELRGKFEEGITETTPLRFWPEKNGLLVIGSCGINLEHRVCYRTGGSPNDWPIIFFTFDVASKYDHYEMSLCEFILEKCYAYPKAGYSAILPEFIHENDERKGKDCTWLWKTSKPHE